MADNFYEQERAREQRDLMPGQSYTAAGLTLGRYTANTFLIMFLGLLVTFGVAWFFSSTFTGFYLLIQMDIAIPYFHLVLLVAQLVVVIAMGAMIRKMSPVAAGVCFFVYALLTGLTFTYYFIIFEVSSLILAFGATALYFGGMAVFGYFTGIDLTRIRTILVGGLIFLVVANILMLFIPGLQVMDRVLCTVGIVIFLGYTAYDTQKIKAFYQYYSADEAMLKKASIFSALQLYLDFVNLFLYVLRLFGKRKN